MSWGAGIGEEHVCRTPQTWVRILTLWWWEEVRVGKYSSSPQEIRFRKLQVAMETDTKRRETEQDDFTCSEGSEINFALSTVGGQW